jgi:alpha-mannosidase
MLSFNPGSAMVARSAAVTKSGAALGEAVSEGDLADEHGNVLASFRQRIRAWVGRPVLELRIDLHVAKEPSYYPWHSYFAARFGWRDDRATIYRGVHGATMPSTANRPGSPEFVEIRFGTARTFLFTGGLPFAQKSGGRLLDVILVPEGETARTFEMMIAIDRDNPAHTAAGWTAPAAVFQTDKGPPGVGPSGWLANVDLPSLLMTSLRPVAAGAGMSRAVAARFIETAGFGGAADLLFARTPSKASLVDIGGEPLSEIAMTGDPVALEFSANELFRVKAEWA